MFVCLCLFVVLSVYAKCVPTRLSSENPHNFCNRSAQTCRGKSLWRPPVARSRRERGSGRPQSRRDWATGKHSFCANRLSLTVTNF